MQPDKRVHRCRHWSCVQRVYSVFLFKVDLATIAFSNCSSIICWVRILVIVSAHCASVKPSISTPSQELMINSLLLTICSALLAVRLSETFVHNLETSGRYLCCKWVASSRWMIFTPRSIFTGRGWSCISGVAGCKAQGSRLYLHVHLCMKCSNEIGPNQVYSAFVERTLVSIMSHNIIWNLSPDQVNSVVLDWKRVQGLWMVWVAVGGVSLAKCLVYY